MIYGIDIDIDVIWLTLGTYICSYCLSVIIIHNYANTKQIDLKYYHIRILMTNHTKHRQSVDSNLFHVFFSFVAFADNH